MVYHVFKVLHAEEPRRTSGRREASCRAWTSDATFFEPLGWAQLIALDYQWRNTHACTSTFVFAGAP
jgi:hypothetical protein